MLTPLGDWKMKPTKFTVLSMALTLALVLGALALAMPAKAQSTSAETVIISNEFPGNAIIILGNTYYQTNPNVYDTLVAIKSNAQPSISNVLTDSFMSTLAACPSSSQIFTTPIASYGRYNAIAVSTDGTVQDYGITYTGSSFKASDSVSVMDTQVSGVGAFRVVYNSTSAALANFGLGNTTYNVFAIIYMPAAYTSPSASASSSTAPTATSTHSATPSASPSVPEFPAAAIAVVAVITFSAVVIAKKRKLF